MTTIAVRELRNHTAEVLRRVQRGEDLVVTQNGVAVATLGPLRAAGPRGPINRADLVRLLGRHVPDSDFAADIAALTSDTTDDLDAL